MRHTSIHADAMVAVHEERAPRVAFTPGRFKPAWWLPGAHPQTIYGGRLRPSPSLALHSETWEMADGQPIRVDVLDGRNAAAPSLVVLHGLESACDVAHVRGMVSVAAARGWASFAASFRGCSGVPLRVAQSYHAGFTDDLEEVLIRVAARRPEAPIFVVGFSLGGNVVLKMLGSSTRLPSSLRAAGTISAPFHLDASTRALDGNHPMVRVYRGLFLKDIRAKVRHYRAAFPGRIDDVDDALLTSFATFDAIISARATGASTVEEYWATQSCAQYLRQVRIPTLLINADDDPLIPGHTIPLDLITTNPHLHLSRHPHGGHVAFVGGQPHAPTFFAEQETGRFLDAVMAHGPW